MAHRKAKLPVLGRQLLVDRITVDGMAVAHAADVVGVSRQTAWKWLLRYEAEGETGLEDRSSRPAHSPRALPQAQVEAILATRREHRFGPHRLARGDGQKQVLELSTLPRVENVALAPSQVHQWPQRAARR